MARPSKYQPTLFDLQPVAKVPALVLDMKQAKVQRNKGIDKAVTHADEETVNWSNRAYQFLLAFLNNHNGPFMAEEVRSYADQLDFDLPPSNRAWGSVVLKAVRSGLIERCGIQAVRNKKAHCANAALWRQIRKA